MIVAHNPIKPSFRGDAKHRTRNPEIPRCAIAHLRSGPSDHSGMIALENLMLTKTPHLCDDATKVTAGDSRWQGQTSEDYWAFVGPFGGCTAATILRALIEHPQAAGDPVAMTVNYWAPIAKGPF